jgi:hypothetical protein
MIASFLAEQNLSEKSPGCPGDFFVPGFAFLPTASGTQRPPNLIGT